MAAESDRGRSRSPRGAAAGVAAETGVSVEQDVEASHRIREEYAPPLQSKFRVAALLRFKRPDGSVGTIGAVNAEPHDANIRGAICAERAALCRFQREEAPRGSRVLRVVCVTDADAPIFPGPLCREFLTATCEPDVEVVAAGTGSKTLVQPLRDLLPLPSLYRRSDQDAMLALGARLGTAAAKPADGDLFAAAYDAAVAKARKQKSQAAVFPVLFAAAVAFGDGRVHCVAELKGIEYGCTVDAVSLLLPELQRVQEEGGPPAAVVVQADNFGLAHAPFAAARSLLMEHGFGEVKLCGHTDEGKWAAPITVRESLPFSNFTEMFE